MLRDHRPTPLLAASLMPLLVAGTAWAAGAQGPPAPPSAEAAPAEQAATPEAWFEEVTAAAGIDFRHTNRTFDNPYARIMEGYTALGASVAVADYNGDGLDDLFLTDSKIDGTNRLYRNDGPTPDGGLHFTEVGEAAGVAQGNDAANASADSLWLDYDNDGHPDLLVVRFGHNLLFHNQGDGTFREVSAEAGLSRYLNSIVAIAFDYDLDGDVDLFYGNYFAPVNLFDPETPRFFPESFESAANGGGVTLFRNDGDGTFTDVTAAAGLAHHTGWSLDLGHGDVDGDGDDDLYVAADFGTDRFFSNNGDGTFTDVTEKAIGIDTKKGMNADWGDFNGDGLLDVYVTNITDEYMREGNFLWQNLGDGTFTDVARETGTHNTGWGWAGKFFDYDNDGWLDLYVVNGWVSAGSENYVLDIFELIVKPDVDLADARNWPPMGEKTLSGYQHNRLFHNQGGALFADEGARHGVDSLEDGRGIAVADFDNDGRLDLFVSNANAAPHFFRNRQPTGNEWVQFRLEGSRSNREGVGAQLRLTAGGRTQVSFVNGGNGFASQSARRVHFGLGGAQAIERLEVVWPSGLRQTFRDIAPGALYDIVEGQKGLRRASPAAPHKTAPGAGEPAGGLGAGPAPTGDG